MTAVYDGRLFKTALEARWAAFFDLANWRWELDPVPVGDWAPDFRVTFPCGHSECGSTHTLLLSVLPIDRIERCSGHPALSHKYGLSGGHDGFHAAVDAGALFGTSPQATSWEFGHGAGGGEFDVPFFENDADRLWTEAGKRVSSLKT